MTSAFIRVFASRDGRCGHHIHNKKNICTMTTIMSSSMYRWSVWFPSFLPMGTFGYSHTRLEHNSELIILPTFNLLLMCVHTHTLHYSMVALPVYVTPQFTFAEGTGKFSIKLGPKQTMGKNVSPISTHVYIGNRPILYSHSRWRK